MRQARLYQGINQRDAGPLSEAKSRSPGSRVDDPPWRALAGSQAANRRILTADFTDRRGWERTALLIRANPSHSWFILFFRKDLSRRGPGRSEIPIPRDPESKIRRGGHWLVMHAGRFADRYLGSARPYLQTPKRRLWRRYRAHRCPRGMDTVWGQARVAERLCTLGLADRVVSRIACPSLDGITDDNLWLSSRRARGRKDRGQSYDATRDGPEQWLVSPAPGLPSPPRTRLLEI